MPRKSFYPLPPSIYPRPIIDPGPVYETTHAHDYGHHPASDKEFFRSRTMNPETIAKIQAETDGVTQPPQGVYPRHGMGTYTLPYYRRDSKGFRKPYIQPPKVDENYMAMSQYRKERSINLSAEANWAHPRSRPNYRDTYPGNTSRNSTWGGIPGATQDLTLNGGQAGDTTVIGAQQRQADHTQAMDTAILQDNIRRQRAGVFGDPLLANPLENANRKSRTVYKRAYGRCR